MAKRTCAGGWLDLRGLLILAALLIPSAVLGVLANNFDTFPLDKRLSAVARALGPAFEPVAFVPNEGNGYIALTALALAAVLLAYRRRHDALALLFVVATMRPLLEIPKDLVNRPRPTGDFAILDMVRDSSFPSGHVMSATTFLGLWFLLAPELVPERFVRPVRYATAVGIALFATARVWAGVPWLSDTIGGVLWASALIALGVAIRPALVRLIGYVRKALRLPPRQRTAD